MTEEQFLAGMTVDEYVPNIRNYRSFIRDLMGEPHPDPLHVGQLTSATTDLPGPVRATFMSEDWCGDAACNLPVIAALFEQAGIELRIIRSSEDSALKEYYESDGDDHIPAVSVWDGGFVEKVRWIESPASIQVQKSAWKEERPEFMELYQKQKSDTKAAKQFAKLYREFMEQMVEWYRENGWNNVTAEIVSQIVPH